MRKGDGIIDNTQNTQTTSYFFGGRKAISFIKSKSWSCFGKWQTIYKELNKCWQFKNFLSKEGTLFISPAHSNISHTLSFQSIFWVCHSDIVAVKNYKFFNKLLFFTLSNRILQKETFLKTILMLTAVFLCLFCPVPVFSYSFLPLLFFKKCAVFLSFACECA